MNEITCPYCDYDFNLCHDDGAYYREDEEEQCECPECEKTFIVRSSCSWHHEGFKADCLNGGEHKWEKMTGYPKEYFVEMFRCSECNEQKCFDEAKRNDAIKEYNSQTQLK